jgi:regulator of sigma E protease
MFGLLIFLVVLSFLIIVHEFGHFIMAKLNGVRVERFALGFGPKLFVKKIRETAYLICAVPLGGYVKLAGDNPAEYSGKPFEYLSKTPVERARIIFCGPLLNYIMAFFCFWLIFYLGYPTLTTKLGKVTKGFGAKEAGIMPQDKITSIDGQGVEYWEQLQKIVREKKAGQTVALGVLRGGQTLRIDVKIKEKEAEDIWGHKKTVGLLGVLPEGEIVKVKYGLFKGLLMGTRKLFNITAITYNAIVRMITGKLAFKDSVTGPLGIFYITTQAAQVGFVAVLHLVAVLNVSLAIFNLLPIPVLDGGHLLFICVEKIKGRALSSKVDKVVTQIGLSFIVSLAFFIFYNDLVKYGIWEKFIHFIKR